MPLKKLKFLIYNSYVYIRYLFGIPTPLKTADREFLENFIFNWVSKQKPKLILFVGVAYYTAHYKNRFFESKFYTCERQFTPYALRNHFRCSIADISSKTSIKFDCIFLNGVIGFGLNDADQIEESLVAIYNQLNIGGFLIIGVNNLSFIQDLILTSDARFKHQFKVLTNLDEFTGGFYLANPMNNHTFVLCQKI